MPLDIYAALSAFVRAEAGRHRERPAAATRPETAPEHTTAPDALPGDARETTEHRHE
ncbi:hypothetical protein PV703_03635 [Streptomyces sp. ME01-24h]|nr:hypothetical protein [Streptomyces sp. ME19-03-3]MDX3352428.1 hypothetical protein [Streptomyces sp. ME01-24h]